MVNQPNDASGDYLEVTDQPLDRTDLDTEGASPPEAQGRDRTAVELAEIKALLKATQGQASRAEREAKELRDVVISTLRNPPQSQLAVSDPFAGIDDQIDDPVVRQLVAQNRQTQAALQQLAAERARERQEAESRRVRDYTIGEIKEAAELASVDFATIEPDLRDINDRELWQEGKKLIKAAKAAPKANRRVEQRQEERELGKYSEQRLSGGQPAPKVSKVRDDYAEGRISSEQYEKQLRSLGYEP